MSDLLVIGDNSATGNFTCIAKEETPLLFINDTLEKVLEVTAEGEVIFEGTTRETLLKVILVILSGYPELQKKVMDRYGNTLDGVVNA